MRTRQLVGHPSILLTLCPPMGDTEDMNYRPMTAACLLYAAGFCGLCLALANTLHI